MRNEVVRLRQRAGSQQAKRWHSRALSSRPFANRAASVVLLFPERSRIAAAEPDALQLVACLELENAELHRQVVELALQIQDLKERQR
jgi:hypothetical protein